MDERKTGYRGIWTESACVACGETDRLKLITIYQRDTSLSCCKYCLPHLETIVEIWQKHG